MGPGARPTCILLAAMALAPVAAVSCDAGREAPAAPPASSLAHALHASAGAPNVPRDLLVAIARVEEGLALPRHRVVDPTNDVPAAGPLQLRRGKLDTLRRGSELVGETELALRSDADLALRAGALVLAEIGSRTDARPDDLASWSRAIEEMSGYADDAHRRAYAHRVFATLARGGTFVGRDGEVITLAPHDLPPSLTLDLSTKLHVLAEAQYEGAELIPTSCKNKCDPTREGNAVELIIIHDTEGNWDASVATLQNDSGKSVQYIVGTDGRVAQFVTEEKTAWHAGNIDFNRRSIGIEHVGYAKEPFPEAEYVASAKLVDHLAAKYDVPRDRAHIIGHDQVPNGTKIARDSPPCSTSPQECWDSPNYGGANRHNDPGIWEWATFMPRFGGEAKCNDVTPLWQCTHDRTKLYRCASERVEVQACAGSCEAGGDTKDATCVIAPQAVAPAPGVLPAPVSPGTRPPAADAPPEEEEEESGCSLAPIRRSRPWQPPATLAAAALALLRLRRQRRRPQPRD